MVFASFSLNVLMGVKFKFLFIGSFQVKNSFIAFFNGENKTVASLGSWYVKMLNWKCHQFWFVHEKLGRAFVSASTYYFPEPEKWY
jgi:hypothetical protein